MAWYTGRRTRTRPACSTCGLVSSSKDVQQATAQAKPRFLQLQVFNLRALPSQPPPISSSHAEGLQVGTCRRDLYSFEVSATVLFCDQNWLVGLETPVFPLLSWSSSPFREFLGISGDFCKQQSMRGQGCLCVHCRVEHLQREHLPHLKTAIWARERNSFRNFSWLKTSKMHPTLACKCQCFDWLLHTKACRTGSEK